MSAQLFTWKCSDGHVFESDKNYQHQICPECKQTTYCRLTEEQREVKQ